MDGIVLREWMMAVLPALRQRTFENSSVKDLTLLAYFFWNDDRIETEFDAMECSFLCAYNAMGILPSVLVVNRTTPRMEAFCAKFGIKIDVDPSLNNGIVSLNRDCILNLHKRFDTKYVLIIQTDGIVVNNGIKRFLDSGYDYVGAPWSRDKFPPRLASYPKYAVGNGGLSLRSRRLCRFAAAIYRFVRFFFRKPRPRLEVEDLFYCISARFCSIWCLQFMKFPTVYQAACFSIEFPTDFTAKKEPIGFHASVGFENYLRHYGLPLKECCKEVADE